MLESACDSYLVTCTFEAHLPPCPCLGISHIRKKPRTWSMRYAWKYCSMCCNPKPTQFDPRAVTWLRICQKEHARTHRSSYRGDDEVGQVGGDNRGNVPAASAATTSTRPCAFRPSCRAGIPSSRRDMTEHADQRCHTTHFSGAVWANPSRQLDVITSNIARSHPDLNIQFVQRPSSSSPSSSYCTSSSSTGRAAT